MNQRQERFCRLIQEGKSHREAARMCEYHPSYGKKLLDKKEIQDYLNRDGETTLCHGPDEVLMLYEKIAFCDLGDFLRFGTREENGKPVSYVELKESSEVDGQLIEEIIISPKGVPKVKLPDRMKALEKLERYYDLLPDTYKRELEERKLQLAREGNEPIQIITNIPRPEEA